MSTSNRKSLEPWIPDTVEYYDHQVSGIRRMATLQSFLLADDMGLGKSLQAITVFTADVARGWATRAIVVAPVSLKANWAEELQDFTTFPFVVLNGTPKQREKLLDEFEDLPAPKFLIVNYEQVDSHLTRLNTYNFDVAIFDEAHNMKNKAAKRTKACHALKARRSFLLTGTPMLNQVSELWSLLHRINPSVYSNYYSFVNRYCQFGGWKNKQVVGAKNTSELNTKLRDVMIRRLKKDVLPIPAPKYIQRKVDLHPTQRKLYDQVEQELCLDVPDIDGFEPMEIENALVKFLKLKQICGTTATVMGPEHDDSFKLDLAIEDAIELIANGRRVVTFTQFRDVQAAFVRRLAEANIPTWQLHGDVAKESRVGVVKDWGSAKPGVIVCMLQVAGVGLNMVQSDVCQFLDKLWVPGLNRQAVDRLHRIGASETQAIDVLEYIARGTVELRIEQILRTKVALNDTVVEQANWKAAIMEALLKKAA